MNDYLVRIMTTDGAIRALACVTTETVAEAARRLTIFSSKPPLREPGAIPALSP